MPDAYTGSGDYAPWHDPVNDQRIANALDALSLNMEGPPCPSCAYWRPRVLLPGEESDLQQGTVRMCWSDEMEHDFSCYTPATQEQAPPPQSFFAGLADSMRIHLEEQASTKSPHTEDYHDPKKGSWALEAKIDASSEISEEERQLQACNKKLILAGKPSYVACKRCGHGPCELGIHLSKKTETDAGAGGERVTREGNRAIPDQVRDQESGN